VGSCFCRFGAHTHARTHAHTRTHEHTPRQPLLPEVVALCTVLIRSCHLELVAPRVMLIRSCHLEPVAPRVRKDIETLTCHAADF
jgi:hypothetical protein